MNNHNKNILIVTQNFYPETFGINDIVQDLAERNFRVDVLTGLPNYPQGKFYDGYNIFKHGEKYYKGARVYRCVVFPRLLNSTLGICLNYASFPIFATLKLFLLMFKKYDRVFVYEPSPIFQCIPALIISWFKSCEKIIYILDIWPESVYSVIDFKSKLFRKMLKSYSAYIYRRFDKVLITSNGFRKQLTNLKIENEKIIYLPQWVPASDYNILHNPLKKKYENTFNIVFTGNVGIPQNLNVLIEAAMLLKNRINVRFIIVGDGDYLKTFKRLVTENKLDGMFVFEGRKPYEDIPKYYDIADALIATLKDIDLFGKIIPAKIPAYMSASKPILCAINGESANIVKEAECGLTSKAGDAKELSENIIKLYKMSPEKRLNMGQNGIKYSKKNFNRKMLLDRLEKILSD